MKKYFSSYWIRSAFYTFLQRFSVTIFGLVNFMILIRSFTKAEMGAWALFLAVTSIFETTKTNLLKNAHIRYVSSTDDVNEKSAIACSSLLLNAGITILFIVLLSFFADILSAWLNAGTELADMLHAFIPGIICMVFFSHFEAIQQSHLDFKGGFAGYFVRQFIFFLIIVGHFVLKIPYTLTHIALYQSFSILIGTLVLFIYSRKYLLFRLNATIIWTKKIVGYGGYIFGSGLMANIFASVDQLMSAKFLSASSVAYYNAASRINGIVDVPSYAASSVLFPKVSRASYQEGNEKVRYLYEKMVALLLVFTVPAALFVIAFPELVITIIAGEEYKDAAFILQLYMITSLMRPMLNQASNILNSIGKPAICFYVNAVSLLINLIINYICLINFGFYGAAIGTLITCCIGSVIWYIIMKKQIGSEFGPVFRYMGEYYKKFYTVALNLISRTKTANL